MKLRAPLLLLPALFQLGWTRDRIVLLVGNRSSNPAASAELAPAVAEQLAAKGYDVVPAADAVAAAREAGIQDPGEILPAAAERLRAALHAEGVVTVTVSFFLGPQARSRGPRASPAFGLAAKMFTSAGKAPWSNSLGWIADDVQQPAAFGSKRGTPKPTALACERLLWSLPRGRPDPAAQTRVAAAEEILKPPVSTRWAPPPRRWREIKGVAHFPLRIR